MKNAPSSGRSSPISDLDEFLFYMDIKIDLIARRHLAALRRTWKTQDFLNRSAAQKRRWAQQKGQQK